MRLKYTQKRTCPLTTTIYTLQKTQTRNQYYILLYIVQAWYMCDDCSLWLTTRWAVTSCTLECSHKLHTYHTSSRVSICVCSCIYMRIYLRVPIDLKQPSRFHWQEAHIREAHIRHLTRASWGCVLSPPLTRSTYTSPQTQTRNQGDSTRPHQARVTRYQLAKVASIYR